MKRGLFLKSALVCVFAPGALLASGLPGNAQALDPRDTPANPSYPMAQAPAPTFMSNNDVVAGTTNMKVLDEKHKLFKGDRLSYRVVEERRAPITLVVTDSGEVEVPLVGRVDATGKSCRELAYAVKSPLEKEYFYTATVIISLDVASSRTRGQVWISGQVRQSGPLELPAGESLTLGQALMRVGLADFAKKTAVRITRKMPDGTHKEIIVNAKDVIDKGKIDKDVELQPDDQIWVPESKINF